MNMMIGGINIITFTRYCHLTLSEVEINSNSVPHSLQTVSAVSPPLKKEAISLKLK